MPDKNEQPENEVEESTEELQMAPPETKYLSELYVVEIPLDDPHFETPWKLRVYAAKVLERRLRDEIEVTDVKVKKPHALAKTKAKLLKRQPVARLYITVKF